MGQLLCPGVMWPLRLLVLCPLCHPIAGVGTRRDKVPGRERLQSPPSVKCDSLAGPGLTLQGKNWNSLTSIPCESPPAKGATAVPGGSRGWERIRQAADQGMKEQSGQNQCCRTFHWDCSGKAVIVPTACCQALTRDGVLQVWLGSLSLDGSPPSPGERADPAELPSWECKNDIEPVILAGNREREQTPACPAPKPTGVAEPGPAHTEPVPSPNRC